MSGTDSREANILNVTFKPKSRKIDFDEASRNKILEFGKEYWDDPDYPGCGGYRNDGRWEATAVQLINFFKLSDKARILDVSCGKGFLLHELKRINSGFEVCGVDISEYAINSAPSSIRDNLILSSSSKLDFDDDHFDLVVCLNSLYIYEYEDCLATLKEIERVGKTAFVQVNSYRSEQEKTNLARWDASARIIKSTSEWRQLFAEVGYTGYYYWTIFL